MMQSLKAIASCLGRLELKGLIIVCQLLWLLLKWHFKGNFVGEFKKITRSKIDRIGKR